MACWIAFRGHRSFLGLLSDYSIFSQSQLVKNTKLSHSVLATLCGATVGAKNEIHLLSISQNPIRSLLDYFLFIEP